VSANVTVRTGQRRLRSHVQAADTWLVVLMVPGCLKPLENKINIPNGFN
jgi:hypothetical protein